MHGKQFVLDAVHAGINEEYAYGRLDFVDGLPEGDFEIVVNLEAWANHATFPRRELRLDAAVERGRMQSWKVSVQGEETVLGSSSAPGDARAALARNFEFRLPLAWLLAAPIEMEKVRGQHDSEVSTRIRLRFSLWRNRLPVDALPLEGWIELELLKEQDLISQ
jgi:hypothetical protein